MLTHNIRYVVEYSNIIIMMDRNKKFDKSGDEKSRVTIDDVLHIFIEISIECGNY